MSNKIGRRAGHTLVELIVAMTLLSILSLVLFELFASASAGFQLTSGRFELQAEVQKITSSLKRELLATSFFSISYHTPSPVFVAGVSTPANRDSLCFAQCEAQGPNAFHETGMLKFDHYILYNARATPAGAPSAELIRMRLSGDNTTQWQGPFKTPLATFLDDPLPTMLLSSKNGGYDTLTKQLFSFRLGFIPSDNSILLTIILRNPEGRLMERGKTTAEMVEATVQVTPNNTFPKL